MVILSNFLVRNFYGKIHILQGVAWITRKSVETVRFHKISSPAKLGEFGSFRHSKVLLSKDLKRINPLEKLKFLSNSPVKFKWLSDIAVLVPLFLWFLLIMLFSTLIDYCLRRPCIFLLSLIFALNIFLFAGNTLSQQKLVKFPWNLLISKFHFP